MYFFICALCFCEIGIVTTVYPTLFAIVLHGEKRVSFSYCFMQMYIFHSLLITENYLLSIMAFDRYIAICKALRYHAIMTLKLSKLLIALCVISGFITPLALLFLIYQLPFCGPNKVHHIYCDSSPLLTLACSNNDVNVIIDFTLSSSTILLASFSVIVTYINILVTIAKMKTSGEQKKAFSTCASHLIISFIFYGSAAFLYIKLETSYSAFYDLATSIHHIVLTPVSSPIVYIFRSKEIRSFLKRFFQPKKIFAANIHVEYVSERINSDTSSQKQITLLPSVASPLRKSLN
ncbi:olfactory receptor 6N2-like [Gastrophryne carolinensis]